MTFSYASKLKLTIPVGTPLFENALDCSVHWKKRSMPKNIIRIIRRCPHQTPHKFIARFIVSKLIIIFLA